MSRVLFTDLDGTLLEAGSYSFEPAEGAIGALRARSIPLIFCTSKTRAEILSLRKRIGNEDPFIAENGGGIFLPPGFGGPSAMLAGPGVHEREGWLEIRLGSPYAEIRAALERLRRDGFPVRGFGDMTDAEVAGWTGLPLDGASLARRRDYAEPFVFDGPADREEELLEEIEKRGLRTTRGRFLHLLGPHDKGVAVRIVRDLYASMRGGEPPRTAAVGDALNDVPMLAAVDHAYLVRRPDGTHEPGVDVPGLVRLGGIGPAGFAEAVRILLDSLPDDARS
jgi:mannosyl-3-phosphoglycerate phosphatase